MWTWTPQVHVDRRLAAPGSSTVVLQGGVLDPLTGDPPVNEYEHVPTAGERSRLPALAVRAGWQRHADASGVSAGVAAFYSRYLDLNDYARF